MPGCKDGKPCAESPATGVHIAGPGASMPSVEVGIAVGDRGYGGPSNGIVAGPIPVPPPVKAPFPPGEEPRYEVPGIGAEPPGEPPFDPVVGSPTRQPTALPCSGPCGGSSESEFGPEWMFYNTANQRKAAHAAHAAALEAVKEAVREEIVRQLMQTCPGESCSCKLIGGGTVTTDNSVFGTRQTRWAWVRVGFFEFEKQTVWTLPGLWAYIHVKFKQSVSGTCQLIVPQIPPEILSYPHR